MTKHARNVARAFQLQLRTAQGFGCIHALAAWGLCTGSVFGALMESGHVRMEEAAEWRRLCGIPTHAEQDRQELDPALFPPPAGKPS